MVSSLNKMSGTYTLPLHGLAAIVNKEMAVSYHVGNISPRIWLLSRNFS